MLRHGRGRRYTDYPTTVGATVDIAFGHLLEFRRKGLEFPTTPRKG